MADDNAVSRAWTDPLATITAAVRTIEPHLAEAHIVEAVIAAVRQKPAQRKLAQALLDHPDLLTSTQPMGPASLQRLIQELLGRGAQQVRSPRCAHCARQKKLPHVHGALRICGTCAARRRTVSEVCVTCGRTAPVIHRDSRGRPCCRNCSPSASRDAMEIIRDHIREADPELSEQAVTSAVLDLAPTTRQQRRIAGTLESVPGLLTGGGAKGTPKVIALIQTLRAAGSATIIVPACPFCERLLPLKFSREGLRCCRRCYDTLRAEECSKCYRIAATTSRTSDGKPLCTLCTREDALNHEPCSRCGRTASIVRRTIEERLCRRCFDMPTAVCSSCGRSRPCYYATTDNPLCLNCVRRLRIKIEQCVKCGNVHPVRGRTAEGGPLCWGCSHRRGPCGTCGQVRRVYGHTADGTGLCHSCYDKNPVSWGECHRCGVRERLHSHGLCHQCTANDQISQLLTGPVGIIRGEAEPLLTALHTSPPKAVLAWIRRPTPRTLLTAIAADTGPITHEYLDQLPHQQRAIQHIRSTLVAAGALESRDEYLAALENWLAQALSDIEDPTERKLVRSFANWHHLRRLRKNTSNTYGQIHGVRRDVRAAIQLLAWLRESGRTLATCTQSDIDRWTTEGPWLRHIARTFLLWAVEHRHASAVEIPLAPREDDATGIEQTRRWEIVRRLFHEETTDLADRVAGLLVLLFAQRLSKIAALTVDHVRQESGVVSLALGTHPLELPPPLDVLVLRLVEERKGQAVVGQVDDHPWLFPGAFAACPLTNKQMMRRIHRLGIRAKPARNTALLDLAGELPAVVLSRLLGITVTTAAHWTRRSGAPRAAYAADFSRRRDSQLRKFH
ncbi:MULTISPECIES: hypothetical protein [unclassified Streptomyces]|uniref:hypothetical protein n=1 Tax=unclassified Streptomyces TaxID=2593676 RepID=UPI00224F30C4|nr:MULTISPECIES: hypothetical protein [unclassified Streptomyces]MCX4405895.1 hypothetical protein [Streptomyces sp. NBC_01764]MCX5189582.1 hypothetical protein [Streptomyces sp. NBC_00268]